MKAMYPKAVVVFGPQGCGKTRNAEYLRWVFRKRRVVEMEECPGGARHRKTDLVLTNRNPKVLPLVYGDRALLVPFKTAMSLR